MQPPESPATFGEFRPCALGGKPPLNGGSKPSKPKPPPPAPAPPQVEMEPEAEAARAANRRRGLASTLMMDQMDPTLGATGTLGAAGTLGKPNRRNMYGGEA